LFSVDADQAPFMNALPPAWDAELPPAASAATDAGDHETVLEHYEDAIRSGSRDPVTLASYGVLLWRLYEFRRGGEAFDEVVADPRAEPALLRRIAHCYFEAGRFGDAARVMRVAVDRLTAPDAATTNTLAWTLERDNQVDAAREEVERALAIDPSYGPAARLLAHLDKRAGDMSRAAERLQEHLRCHPSEFDWGLNYELAGVLDRLGEYDAAWEALSRAKSQLRTAAQVHLRDSHFIRRRQAELVQSITAADLRRWQVAASGLTPLKRLALLTGFPRSGTTLIEQIIESHPDAIGTDESGILPRQFIEPLVWKAADADTALIELRSFDASQLTAGRETFYRLTENYLDEHVGPRLLVEKNPLLTADLPVPLRMFPEASALIALRDPRDVVLSYLFTMVPLNWSSAPAVDVVEACRFYADVMRHWLWWRPRLEQPMCEMRYEQMIADPAGEIRRVAEFLGLEWTPSMLDERRRSERRAVRTPTYDDVTKPLYTRALGRWKNYERYLAPGLPALQPFLEAFGYTD
jgi:tetratricopeptide (TPR) repeat protein